MNVSSINSNNLNASPKTGINFSAKDKRAEFQVNTSGYEKIEDLTDNQIQEINSTKNLPDGIYLLVRTRTAGGIRDCSRAVQEMNIVKVVPQKIAHEEMFYRRTIPDDCEVMKYKGKTYFKEKGVDLEKHMSESDLALKCTTVAGGLVLAITALVAFAKRKKTF